MSSIIEHLEAAKNSLTPDNWHQGNYFVNKNNTLCMCSHGAVQAQVNPACSKAIDYYKSEIDASAKVVEFVHGDTQCAADIANERTNFMNIITAARVANIFDTVQHASIKYTTKPTKQIWIDRPDWVQKTDNVYGRTDAHYLLGMVGLTTSFNDANTTTLEMVHRKFDEAIELARALNL